MRERPAGLLILALAMLAGGCGKKPEPKTMPEPSAGDRGPGSPAGPGSANPGNTGAGASAGAEAVASGLRAELAGAIHFDFDQDAVKPEDRPVLNRKAAILLANPALRLRISGHADARGSDEYNLVLGNKRALAARRYLEGKGVDASRIEVTSYGEERPVDPGQTEEAWAKNRRDEFEILSGGDRLVAPR